MRVLIVEDERNLADALGAIMEREHYVCDVVYNGQDGLEYALAGQYDVMVLDVMLPRMNGYDVVHNMRRHKNATPVLMLTARDEISSKVEGLDSGADDYMTKPFSSEELLARMRALSRRQGDVVMDELIFEDLHLNLSNSELSCGEKRLHLGYKEYLVLKELMLVPKTAVPKDEIIAKVWGLDSDAEDNNVEAYISFIRKKLAYLGSKVSVATLRKIGYRLEVNEK